VWQSIASAAPAIVLALTVGATLMRATGSTVSSGGSSATWCEAPGNECESPATAGPYTHTISLPDVERAVPVPLDDLALAGGLALLAVLATVGVGLLFLRSSTSLEELRAT
jgi:hypothetical protein